MNKFRTLKEDEIEVRVDTITANGCSLLLYKTARTDAKILDETVGSMNWKVDYKVLKDNMYCGISIFDDDKKEWICKWNCGKETFAASEKGEASDALKRAGFTWGIGVELYTAPFIWIDKTCVAIEKNQKDKFITYDRFYVEKIEISEDKKIKKLAIKRKKDNKRVFLLTNCDENGD